MGRTRARGGHRPGAACIIAGLAALLTGALWWPAGAEATPDAPGAPRAAATCPESVLDSYQPGDEVTVVGYASGCVRDVSEPLVVSAYLHADPCAHVELPYCFGPGGLTDPTTGTPLGTFTLAATPEQTLGLRMELTFTLPVGMASGLYYLAVCRDPCDHGVFGGDATPLYVGVDPPPDGRPVRHWPLDDPAIGDLPDDALLVGGDGQTIITAADARGTAGAATTSGEDQAQEYQAAAPAEDQVDPTDLIAVEPRTTGQPSDGTDPWRPPAWSLAAAGLVMLSLAAATRRATGRKQVRQPDQLGQG